MAQWWETLLHATGGKLELDKCFYYIMPWEVVEDGNVRGVTTEELGGDTITIRQSGDNEEVEITHKDCNTAHRTLGVMINPAGTQTAEAERLLETTRESQEDRCKGSSRLSSTALCSSGILEYSPARNGVQSTSDNIFRRRA
jgi:hypothetical protein